MVNGRFTALVEIVFELIVEYVPNDNATVLVLRLVPMMVEPSSTFVNRVEVVTVERPLYEFVITVDP